MYQYPQYKIQYDFKSFWEYEEAFSFYMNTKDRTDILHVEKPRLCHITNHCGRHEYYEVVVQLPPEGE